MKTEVIDQLLLDFEGLATFFTLMSAKETGKDEENTNSSLAKFLKARDKFNAKFCKPMSST